MSFAGRSEYDLLTADTRSVALAVRTVAVQLVVQGGLEKEISVVVRAIPPLLSRLRYEVRQQTKSLVAAFSFCCTSCPCCGSPLLMGLC